MLKLLSRLKSLHLKFNCEEQSTNNEVCSSLQALEACISLQNLHLDVLWLILHPY